MNVNTKCIPHACNYNFQTYIWHNVMKCRKNVSFSRRRDNMGWSNHRFYYSSIVTYSSIPIVLYITKTAFGDIQVQVSSLLCQINNIMYLLRVECFLAYDKFLIVISHHLVIDLKTIHCTFHVIIYFSKSFRIFIK